MKASRQDGHVTGNTSVLTATPGSGKCALAMLCNLSSVSALCTLEIAFHESAVDCDARQVPRSLVSKSWSCKSIS
jgi:hypothetical protein